jgi:hypothetical protein
LNAEATDQRRRLNQFRITADPVWLRQPRRGAVSGSGRFDPARKNNAHLDFGAGAHACLGLHLARLETQIAIPTLLERYPRMELRETEPEWGRTLTLRGLKRLNVVLHAS